MPRIDSTPVSRPGVESTRSPGATLGVPGAQSSDIARPTRALLGLFLLSGLLASSWIARIPAVRDDLGLTTAELGALLPAIAVGAMVTVGVAAPVMAAIGGARTLAVSTAGHLIAFTLLGLAPVLGSIPLLVAGLVLNGGSFALGNLPLNVESAGLERRAGKAILSRFHAAFSLGTVVGSLVGVACAAASVPVYLQFIAVAILGVIWRACAIPLVIHETRRPAAVSRSGGDRDHVAEPTRTRSRGAGGWREGYALALGLIVLAAAMGEGAANDWLSLAVIDGFDRSDAVGAAAFGVFVTSMTVVRMLGGRLIDRFGSLAIVRASAIVAAGGIVVLVTVPILPIALVGVVAWGCGTGLVVPIAITAASQDPVRAAGRIAVVSGMASCAALIFPPIVGLAASWVGARTALLLVLLVAAVILALSAQVAPERGTRRTRASRRAQRATTAIERPQMADADHPVVRPHHHPAREFVS